MLSLRVYHYWCPQPYFQFSSIGEATPDLKYRGEPTTLTIGDDNVIRESVTIHRGTVQDRGDTFIGNSNLIMCYVHIGHDSVVRNNTILVNNTALAGHVVVDDWAIFWLYARASILQNRRTQLQRNGHGDW